MKEINNYAKRAPVLICAVTKKTYSDNKNYNRFHFHNRKLMTTLSRELKEKDSEIQELKQTVSSLENKLNELSIQAKK